MALTPTNFGALRVVGGADTTAQIDAANAARAAVASPNADSSLLGLPGFIIDQLELMKRHRNNSNAGWAHRLLVAMRAFNGQYDPDKLRDIRQFKGSEVYARTTAMKCRGTSALLRDVYLGTDKAWGLDPDPDPKIPDAIMQAIQTLVQSEIAGAAQAHAEYQNSLNQPNPATAGFAQQPDPNQPNAQQPDPNQPAPPPPPPDPGAIRDRIAQLTEAARQAAKKKAADQAKIAEDKIEDILREGGFYKALDEFIADVPLFPFGCIKGPTVRLRTTVKWVTGPAGGPDAGVSKPVSSEEPRLIWTRVSPFDLYWTPGVSDIADANVIERSRLTRGEINDLLDLPGYNVDEVRAVLDEYGRGGLDDNWDQTDAERAVQENRENPKINKSGLIATLEFQGYAQGRILIDAGMDPALVPDELRDYFVQAWLIGRHVVKVQMAPSPRKRHQYYVTSFEKVPGTPVGNGLPDILADIQDVSNAVLRALVNNLSISSGPQVVINTDRLADGENAEELYPWKRWHMRSDPMGNNQEQPVAFFMPTSNAQEFLSVYSAFSEMADELSAIPRYMTGAQAGAAGRTASGLSMLMSNSSKILQTVASNIDRDVIEGLLEGLFDMVLLTDTSGLLTGEESIRVKGVNVAIQKETQRARQLEFLQATANPIDAQIMGPKGRATVLRSVSQTLGMPGEQIVPSDDALAAMQKQSAQIAAQQGQPGHGGMGQQAAQAQGNQGKSQVNNDQGPRTNLVGPNANTPQRQTPIAGGPQ